MRVVVMGFAIRIFSIIAMKYNWGHPQCIFARVVLVFLVLEERLHCRQQGSLVTPAYLAQVSK